MDAVTDSANVENATQEIIKETGSVGKTAESGASEATEIARIAEKNAKRPSKAY